MQDCKPSQSDQHATLEQTCGFFSQKGASAGILRTLWLSLLGCEQMREESRGQALRMSGEHPQRRPRLRRLNCQQSDLHLEQPSVIWNTSSLPDKLWLLETH